MPLTGCGLLTMKEWILWNFPVDFVISVTRLGFRRCGDTPNHDITNWFGGDQRLWSNMTDWFRGDHWLWTNVADRFLDDQRFWGNMRHATASLYEAREQEL